MFDHHVTIARTDRVADRAIIKMKGREIRRKYFPAGCHSVRSANHMEKDLR